MRMPLRFAWSAAVAALVGLLAGAGSAAQAQGLPSGLAAPQSSPAITLHADGERATVRSAGTGARSLLAELAQRGRFSVVNLDRVPETPIAIEFTDTPLARVVESVLRGAAVDFIAVGGQPGFALSKVIVSGRTASAGDRAAIGPAVGLGALAGGRAATAQALPPGGEDHSAAAAADPEPPLRARDLEERRMLDDTRTALVVGGRDRESVTGAGARTGTAGPGAGPAGYPIGGAGMAMGGLTVAGGGSGVVVGDVAAGTPSAAASGSSGTYSQPVRPVRLEEVVMPNAAPSGPPVGGPVTIGAIVGGAQSPVSGPSGVPTVTAGTAPVSTLGAQPPGMSAPGPLTPTPATAAPTLEPVIAGTPATDPAAPGAMPLPPGAVSAQPTTGTISGPVPMTGPPPGTPAQSANPTPPKPATAVTGTPIIK